MDKIHKSTARVTSGIQGPAEVTPFKVGKMLLRYRMTRFWFCNRRFGIGYQLIKKSITSPGHSIWIKNYILLLVLEAKNMAYTRLFYFRVIKNLEILYTRACMAAFNVIRLPVSLIVFISRMCDHHPRGSIMVAETPSLHLPPYRKKRKRGRTQQTLSKRLSINPHYFCIQVCL